MPPDDTNTGTTAATAAATGGTAAAAQTQVQKTGVPAAPAWFPDATTDDLAHISNRGWDKAENPAKAVYQSYRNLEKLTGAIKTDTAVIIPSEGADQKTIDQFQIRLGRPETIEKYGVKAKEFTGMPEETSQSLIKVGFDNGFTDKQMAAIQKWNNDSGATFVKQLEDNAKVQLATQQAALKTEWGAAHDQNLKSAQEAAAKLGWTKPQIDAMQVGLGFDGVMKFALKMGAAVGEGKFISDTASGARQGAQEGVMTPEQANKALTALSSDKEFMKAWSNKAHPGHGEAVAKKAQLSAWAVAGKAV